MTIRNLTPAILLPFEKGILSSAISCVRAGTATRINSRGEIEDVAANTPRIDYSIDSICLGLLCEDTSTNLFTQSDTSNWTLNGATTRTYMTYLGYTGVNITNPGGSTGYSVAALSLPAGTYSFSVYIRGVAGLRSDVRLRANRNTDGIVDYAPAIGDTFERFVHTFTVSTTQNVTLSVSNTGSTGGMNVDCVAFQLEALPFATSFIKTSGTTVTRAADLNTYTIPAGKFSGEQGTWLFKYDLFTLPSSNSQVLAAISRSGALTSEFFLIGVASPSSTLYRLFSQFNADTSARPIGEISVTPLLRTTIKSAITFSSTQNDITPQQKLFYAGSLLATATKSDVMKDSMGTAYTPEAKLLIGQRNQISPGSPLCLNGHVKKIVYYPGVLSDSEISQLYLTN